jgi:hypothetical protein
VEQVTGSFEIHIFVEPFDPPEDVAEKFRAACAGAASPMKALLLRLDYAGKGFVGVLQSSRYVQGTPETARDAAALDAAVLRAAGFTVIREKVEAIAANAGVPRTGEEGSRSPADRYFEFHVLIDGRTFPLSEDDMLALRRISEQFASKLGQPVPLSYNALKPAQRFLNLRARGVGLESAMETVHQLEEAVRSAGDIMVKKVIAEYICFDSNRAVDNGWLEPLS